MVQAELHIVNKGRHFLSVHNSTHKSRTHADWHFGDWAGGDPHQIRRPLACPSPLTNISATRTEMISSIWPILRLNNTTDGNVTF